MNTASLVPSAVYEATSDRVVIAYRDSADVARIVEVDPAAIPGFISQLMSARHQHKLYHRLRQAAAAQPPPAGPAERRALTDRVRAKLLEGGPRP